MGSYTDTQRAEAAWTAMPALFESAGVTAVDMIGLVSDYALRTWFGYDDTNNHAGIVYFVSTTDATYGPVVKIGYTRHLKQRLAHLQTYSPHPIVYEGALPGDRKIEKALHDRFTDLRVQGEWFTRTPELDLVVDHIRHLHPELNRTVMP